MFSAAVLNFRESNRQQPTLGDGFDEIHTCMAKHQDWLQKKAELPGCVESIIVFEELLQIMKPQTIFLITRTYKNKKKNSKDED